MMFSRVAALSRPVHFSAQTLPEGPSKPNTHVITLAELAKNFEEDLNVRPRCDTLGAFRRWLEGRVETTFFVVHGHSPQADQPFDAAKAAKAFVRKKKIDERLNLKKLKAGDHRGMAEKILPWLNRILSGEL